MRILIGIALLTTMNAAIALEGRALEIYQQQHPESSDNSQTTSNTTVIDTSPNNVVVNPDQNPNNAARPVEHNNEFNNPYKKEGQRGAEQTNHSHDETEHSGSGERERR